MEELFIFITPFSQCTGVRPGSAGSECLVPLLPAHSVGCHGAQAAGQRGSLQDPLLYGQYISIACFVVYGVYACTCSMCCVLIKSQSCDACVFNDPSDENDDCSVERQLMYIQ